MNRYLNPLEERIDAIRSLVDVQADDEGLWFVAESAAEAYLQQELRTLHTACEALVACYDLNGLR